MSLSIPDEVRRLMVPSAAALEPYDPEFSAVEVNLSANENTVGLPPSVAAKVKEALASTHLNRYPPALSDELRGSLAAIHGIGRDQVIIGNGGDELLFNLFLAFGGSGRTLVTCSPTFSVYRTYAQLLGTTVVDAARLDNFEVNIAEVVATSQESNAAITVVTSPNNPTGNVVSRLDVVALCEGCPGIVLIDQAYVEFAFRDVDVSSLVATYPNLVVLRTFSKAYALAGLRVGYVLASAGVVAALAAVRQPYSVNVLAQAAARAVVACRGECKSVINAIVAERERLRARLADMGSLGVTAFPSEANFLLVRVPHARRTWERLRDEHSVLVRDFSSTPGLAGCLRVSVGRPGENDRLIAGLEAVLG